MFGMDLEIANTGSKNTLSLGFSYTSKAKPKAKINESPVPISTRNNV